MRETSVMPRSPKPPPRASRRTQVSLLLVDDHPMWRSTLRTILVHSKAGKIVGEASDGTEAVAMARKIRPDVVVMDVNLPTMDGIEATRRLIAHSPAVKVLVLASSDERSQVIEAVRAGAAGYVLKTAEPEEVVAAVRRVAGGELVFPSSIADFVLEELRETEPGVRVIVGDEAVLAREGLVRVLNEGGFEVVGATGDPAELVEQATADSPDVVLVDASMSKAATEIRDRCPDVAVLVLAGKPDARKVEGLLARSASGVGYLLKERITNLDELGDAVRRVARGESVVDPQIVSGLVGRRRQRAALEDLTPREIEVLSLMAEGHSNQAIVEKMFLGHKTVEAHVRSIFTKLGLEQASDVHRRVLAVITYLRST